MNLNCMKISKAWQRNRFCGFRGKALMHECKDLLANQLLLYALAYFSDIKRTTETIIV
jgi:hypothetical protein